MKPTILAAVFAPFIMSSVALAQSAPATPPASPMAAPAAMAPMAPAAMAAMAPATMAAPADDPVARGKALAFNKSKGNCLACHDIAGGTMAGNVGPALKDVKLLVPDPKQLYNIIYNEQSRNPQTIMPAFGRNGILTSDEINDIVAFLYTK